MGADDRTAESQRFAQIESTLMMLQYDYEKLNDVILAQQAEIDALKRTLLRVEQQIPPSEPEDRRLEDERPPHY